MSISWFPFNIKDFLANTKRLNTEAKGAYLLLMLDFYEQGTPAPNDDKVLATITELSLEAWKGHRKVLEPLFNVKGGFWHHERMERELLVAEQKHASVVARSKAAHEARYGKPAPSGASDLPQAGHKQTKSRKSATGRPQAAPQALQTASSNPAHLQEHTTLSTERVVPAAPNDDARQVGNGLGEGRQEPNPLGTTLPETWVPDVGDIATAGAYGMPPSEIEPEVLKFHAYNAQHGTFSKNWSATWQMWCARWKEREAAKPKLIPPRVEVNTTAEPYVPKPAEYDRALTRWASGDQSGWPRRALGPEPGQAGCKVPSEYLDKFDIDPKTGLVRLDHKVDT